MTDLETARGEIDRIDRELVRLLVRRLAVSRDVALAKRATGADVADPAREQKVLDRVSELAGPADAEAARQMFATLFEISKKRQREILDAGSEGVR